MAFEAANTVNCHSSCNTLGLAKNNMSSQRKRERERVEEWESVGGSGRGR